MRNFEWGHPKETKHKILKSSATSAGLLYKQCRHINYLRFFCKEDLSVIPNLLIYSIIYWNNIVLARLVHFGGSEGTGYSRILSQADGCQEILAFFGL